MRLLVLLASVLMTVAAVSCMDEKGNAVDWFVAIKAPDGINYYYTDANSGPGLSMSSSDLNSPGAIYYSVGQIFQAQSSEGVLVWNDEAEGHNSETDAHAKGMLFFDDSTGMYVVHSAPEFPSSSGYGYPSSATRYGQSFLCISIDSRGVQDIIYALGVIRPQLYMSSASSSLKSSYTALGGLLNGNYTSSPYAYSYALHSVGGVAFTVFAKNKQWDSFLYEDLVAPAINSDLIAETWTNGALDNIIPSTCKNASVPYNVWNAMHVAFDPSNPWARTKDHSKWAVGVHSSWLCIGGINRQFSQNLRGGGTVCSTQLGLQPTFHAAVIDVNACGTGQVTDRGSTPPMPMNKAVIN